MQTKKCTSILTYMLKRWKNPKSKKKIIYQSQSFRHVARWPLFSLENICHSFLMLYCRRIPWECKYSQINFNVDKHTCTSKHALKYYHEYAMLYMWSFLYKGATIWFWSGGGGAGKFCRDRIFFSAWGRPENLFSGILRPEYLLSPAKKFWKSTPPPEKNPRQQQGVGGGGGNVAWFRRVAGKDLLYDFYYIPGLKGSPGASCNRIVCTSVRPSFLPAFKEQYLKFGWWYSYQKWTVSSSLDCSHFPDIPPMPLGWDVVKL